MLKSIPPATIPLLYDQGRYDLLYLDEADLSDSTNGHNTGMDVDMPCQDSNSATASLSLTYRVLSSGVSTGYSLLS